MKKIIISIGLCLVGLVAVAQSVDDVNNAAYVNKRGVYLLPQAGDFAFGIDASPLLRYVGNFFSSSNSEPKLYDQAIYGKYFLQDNRALRAKLSLGFTNSQNKGFSNDEILSDATVTDVLKMSGANVELGFGYELRRGRGRVQGFYGGQVVLGYCGGKFRYDYGNRMDEDYKNPESFDFKGEYNVVWYHENVYVENLIGPLVSDGRVTELKFGNTFSAGLGAFAGVEYFFAPHMSLGFEVNLGFLFSTTGEAKRTVEKWDFIDDERQIRTTKSNFIDGALYVGGRTYTSANIFLMFHF